MAQTQESARLPPLLSGLLRITKLSQKAIEELQQIIHEVYGKDLTLEDSRILAEGLVGYFDLLAKIHHRSTTFAKTNEPESFSVARDVNSLGAKTSM